MLTGFRADAARDRDELRIDLRARAERAERQTDAYRDELVQLRAGTSHDTDTTASRTPRRTRPSTQPQPASPLEQAEAAHSRQGVSGEVLVPILRLSRQSPDGGASGAAGRLERRGEVLTIG